MVTNFQLKNDFRETKTNIFLYLSVFVLRKKLKSFWQEICFESFFISPILSKVIFFISGIFFEFSNQNFFLKFLSSAKTAEKRKKCLKLFSGKGFWGEHFSMLASKVQCTIMTICSLFFFFKPVGRQNSDENCCQRWDLNRGSQV